MHPLKLIRNDQLLTQENLACGAKVSIRTITNIERGVSRPMYHIRRRILKFLGISFAEHRSIFDKQEA